ncbi:MAG: hypothetical protein IJI14_05015 [Anaerolineaceae bacterium]|nr:hypothetical protein [Anaerolineaceae bacterium]
MKFYNSLKIIIVLLFLFVINTNFCFSQYVSDPSLLDPPMVSDTKVQGEANDKCKEAQAISTDQNLVRAKTSNNSRTTHCVNLSFSLRHPEECSKSSDEYLLDYGERFFNMCNLINAEEVSPCEDPSNFVGPKPDLASSCPCPGGVEIKQDGCNITFTCKIGGDHDASVTVTSPCPTIRGTDPQYPLVKMLAGTLIEWNEPADVTYTDWELTFGAPAGTGAPGGSYGAAAYNGVDYEVIVSSLDLGQNTRFSLNRANAIKNSKNPLDRKNIKFKLTGGNEYVEVLDQHDIYNAYKKKGPEVQAYLALAGKGWGERPWTTYEKFIDAMCNMSSSKSRCKKELAYYGHRDTEMQDNLYLGNGDMSIIGLYSEISSHGCHGATVINDKGQPAFGIEISSTWCFYLHASWADYSTWQIRSCEFFKKCCVELGIHITEYDCCVRESFDEEYEEYVCEEMGKCKKEEYYCKKELDHYIIHEDWISQGGGESTGDCGQCATVTGYMDIDGNYSQDPYPISFYQSQPLLIRD